MVGFAEMLAAEKAGVGGERGGVWGGEDEMFGGVDDGAFVLGVFAPEQKYQVLFFVGEGFDGGVGELFPALFLMRSGGVGANGEGGVEEEDALFGPIIQVAFGWVGNI